MSRLKVMARAVAWLAGDDTGMSSKALCRHMLGLQHGKWGPSHPHDPADLGRCLRLLELIPEWKPRLPEMAALCPEWAALVARWPALTAIMADEVGINCEKVNRANRTYQAMKAALAPSQPGGA